MQTKQTYFLRIHHKISLHTLIVYIHAYLVLFAYMHKYLFTYMYTLWYVYRCIHAWLEYNYACTVCVFSEKWIWLLCVWHWYVSLQLMTQQTLPQMFSLPFKYLVFIHRLPHVKRTMFPNKDMHPIWVRTTGIFINCLLQVLISDLLNHNL